MDCDLVEEPGTLPNHRFKEIRLDESIAVETVTPVLDELAAAKEGDELLLYMRHNYGGSVDQLFLLIRAISLTKATVTITFGRFVMSSAATLWLWFLLWPAPNVASVYPKKPAVLMYHRPRWAAPDGQYYCFAEDLPTGDARRLPLEEKISIFDSLFEALLTGFGWEQIQTSLDHEGASCMHWLHHLREAYYGNKDCLIPVQSREA